MLKIKQIMLFSITMVSLLPKIYAQTDSITISGKLNGLANRTIWLGFLNDEGKAKTYKAIATNDVFSFKVPKLTNPSIANFDVYFNRTLKATVNGQLVGSPAPKLDLFVYNKDIKIIGDALLVQFAMVSGDDENNTFNVYKQLVKADEQLNYENTVALFNAKYYNKPLKDDPDKLKEEAAAARKRTHQNQKDFVNTHPDAFTSVFLMNRLQSLYNANDYTQVWNSLSNKYKDNQAAEKIKVYIQKVSSTLAGATAVNFERKDKDGNLINLASYKGKTVLLDFWGSWCGPCRSSHPHLKVLYDKYKSKGFEIIAIAQERSKSLDECKATWLKAIKDDGINWIHILNQDGIEKEDIVKNYQITAFPTKILIDKEGKIILRISASVSNDIDTELEKIYGF